MTRAVAPSVAPSQAMFFPCKLIAFESLSQGKAISSESLSKPVAENGSERARRPSWVVQALMQALEVLERVNLERESLHSCCACPTHWQPSCNPPHVLTAAAAGIGQLHETAT